MSTDYQEYQKYISELMGLGFDWKVIKSKTQERFSNLGSSIAAQNKPTSFTQNTIAMHNTFQNLLVSLNMLIASSQQTQLV